MIQTHWVITRLHHLWPDLEIVIEQIHTTGDRVTNAPLTQIGGDGVFVTEIEYALHERRIDLAVHSLKDMPTTQPEGLRLFIAGPREDVRDVFVSAVPMQITRQGLFAVEKEALAGSALRVGTCSLRRTAQIRTLSPDAEILPLRGNVDTRLRKLEAGEYDGIILAAAGLHRMEIAERDRRNMQYFPIELMLPAPGQGALALETRNEPALCALLAPLNDAVVEAATGAERTFMRELGAGCYLPVAAYGEVSAEQLHARGLVISLDGQQRISVNDSIPWHAAMSVEDARNLGIRLAHQALAQGAAQIIQEIQQGKATERQYV